MINRPGDDHEWKYAVVTEHEAKLDINEIKNGDELQVQVLSFINFFLFIYA